MTFPDWTGATVVCLASGPSLTAEDCARVRGLPTIVTNTTFRRCPWADAVFGADVNWWTWHLQEVRATCAGLRFCDYERRGTVNAHRHPRYRSFGNSGACAIALAVACGASTIILLGYDCQLTGGRLHHHGRHGHGLRNCDTLPKWAGQFAALAKWSSARIINCSRVSALTCFARLALEDALDGSVLAPLAPIASATGATTELRPAGDR